MTEWRPASHVSVLLAGNRSPFRECEGPGVAGPLQAHPPSEGRAYISYFHRIIVYEVLFLCEKWLTRVSLKHILKAMNREIKQRKHTPAWL